MGFLGNRMQGPRAFEHKPIYVDARKEKLQKMEEQAKRELGMLPETNEVNPEKIRGKFVESTTHLKRRKEKAKRPYTFAIILVAILLLIFLWNLILTGEWSFSLF